MNNSWSIHGYSCLTTQLSQAPFRSVLRSLRLTVLRFTVIYFRYNNRITEQPQNRITEQVECLRNLNLTIEHKLS